MGVKPVCPSRGANMCGKGLISKIGIVAKELLNVLVIKLICCGIPLLLFLIASVGLETFLSGALYTGMGLLILAILVWWIRKTRVRRSRVPHETKKLG